MTYHSITTLAEIRAADPCEEGWQKLLRHLGKTKADSEPLPLLTVLDSNGLDDALWCLQVPSLDRLSRHFQAWCAEQVLHHFESERPTDTRVRDQIATLRNDGASEGERVAAKDAARDAARDAAWVAARVAARVAAWDAAWVAAWDAAWVAARVAARLAARDAARDAAWDAARLAARVAARDAAWVAARLAARVAARDAAWVAAWDAAWVAARDAQEKQLRLMLAEGGAS